MPSEYIIYMSAFVIGILTLTAFSVTYRNLDDQATQIVANQTLQNLVQDIASKIQNLYQQIYYLILNYGNTTTFSTSIAVSLPSKVQSEYYRIRVSVDGNTGNSQTLKVLGYYERDLNNPEAVHNAFVDAHSTTVSGEFISLDNIHTIILNYDGAGNFNLTLQSTS